MTLTAGTKLGPYEILAPLGAGGMGEVYRARDSKLQREVAIKVLPQVVANDPETLARFEREALAVASLSHPNILAIHDFGNDNGVAYAVMELLEGDTLRAKLDAGALPQKQALDYALQIARGLSAAHQKGLVHRDLKPENLFVTRDGHVKILDFGLAKKVGTAGPAEVTSAPTVSGHTEPGVVMGTVGYMSPEQVRGLAVDHRSDIFSFGTILYELLSGQRAFRKQTAADTMSAILKEEPLELTGAGPALDHIVRHCLEKDRDDRFQSAKDIAFALGESASFPIASGAQASLAPAGQRRVFFGVAALVLAVAGFLLSRRPARVDAGAVKRVAVLPFENLGSPEDDYFADGVADEVRGKLTSLPGVQVIARGSSTPYKKTSKPPGQIAKELNVGYLLTATVRWDKGGSTNRVHVSPELVEVTGSGAPTSKWQQPFDAPLTDVFGVQSEIAVSVARALGVVLGGVESRRLEATPTQNMAAYEAFLRGEDSNRKEDNERQAIAFYEQAVALDPGFHQAWAALGWVSSWRYASEAPTAELAERSRQAAEKAVTLAPDRPEGYLALGGYLWLVLRDLNRAMDAIDKGLQLTPGNTDLLIARGAVQVNLGRWQEALKDYRQAERLDPRSPDSKIFLASELIWMRQYHEAGEVLGQGLALAPKMGSMIGTKAHWSLAQGDLAGARAVLQEALKADPTALAAFTASFVGVWVLDEQQRELLVRLTPEVFNNRVEWAFCLTAAYALRGDATNLRLYAEEARKASEEILRSTPQRDTSHANLGKALAYLGRKDEAIREGERAVALAPVKDGLSGVVMQENLASIYLILGDREKALDVLEHLIAVPSGPSPAQLNIDPNFDPLRGNPRFQKLIAAAN